MLLTEANLEAWVKKQDRTNTCIDRIHAYVEDQRRQQPHYQSPNSSISMPASVISDVRSTAFTASISEIIRRKQKRPSNGPTDTKRVKASKLPTSNGLHLLKKFISPNLEIERITTRHHTRPRLGLFNKGKSSAHGKAGNSFLKKPTAPRQPSISRFFQKESSHPIQKPSPTRVNSSSHSILPKQPTSKISPSTRPWAQRHSSVFSQAKPYPLISPPPPLVSRHLPAPSLHRQSPLSRSPLPSRQSDHLVSPPLSRHKSFSFSSSYGSIERLLSECRNEDYVNEQQLPTYPSVKSFKMSSPGVSYPHHQSSPSKESSIYKYCQSPLLKRQGKTSPFDKTQPESFVSLNWQLDHSSSLENDEDFDFHPSMAQYHLSETTEDIHDFWTPYRR
ncbi:hypothetical protein A0J61_05766 [Choanephora cucurbitarum]|uniref:Uncharacterized protein n=1 Tax=Choanephora cucurbitarum TaxID=101091 RepID=A0A1C7NAP5_9FUNG|nr:hypothetical protein A0J61_05766 [Choanephora cucurbitarum]